MAACSGFVYAYSVADAYLRSGQFKNALVIGAETLSRFLDYSDRGDVHPLRRRRRRGRAVGLRRGGRRPAGPRDDDRPRRRVHDLAALGRLALAGDRPDARARRALRAHGGQETYRFATKTMATTALKAIERAGWKPDEIDLFIPHQANVRIIESVAKGLGLPMDKMFVNLDRYGNTSAASVPIALAEAVDSGRIKIGDKVVLVAFGAGLTSGRHRDGVDGRSVVRPARRVGRAGRQRARAAGLVARSTRSPSGCARSSRRGPARAARRRRPRRARARPPQRGPRQSPTA